MKNNCRFKPGDRIVVWITHRTDVYEGDSGTVVKIINPDVNHSWRITAILDTGVKMENYTEDTFKHEMDYDPNIPF